MPLPEQDDHKTLRFVCEPGGIAALPDVVVKRVMQTSFPGSRLRPRNVPTILRPLSALTFAGQLRESAA